MHKKLLSLITFSTITLFASAQQDFTYPLGQHLVVDVENENYESYQIDVTTPTPEAIRFDWTLVSNTLPSEWSYSLCDYGGCAVGIPPYGSMTPISLSEAQNGTKGWFKLNLTVGQVYGQGKVEIYVYDSNDINRGDTVSWFITWDGSSASISENQYESEINVYQNPDSKEIHVSNLTDAKQISFYTLSGRKVSDVYPTSESMIINSSDFEEGIYIIQIRNAEGGLLTKKVYLN